MRNIDRIDDTLIKVGRIWKKYPDLRLGQLLSVAAGDYSLFAIEDEHLVRKIEDLFKKESDNNDKN